MWRLKWIHPMDGVTASTTHTQTNTTQRIMSYPKASLTSDPQGQGRHTLGDKWSTGPIVHTVSLSIYWLPKWSIMKWFTRSTATPPGTSKRPVGRCLLHSADICTNGPSIWFIREWTEAGPRHLWCLFKANRRVRKLLWMQDVTSGVRHKRYRWSSAGNKENMSLNQTLGKRRKNIPCFVFLKITNNSSKT